MNRGEGLFGYQPSASIEEHLRPLRMKVDSCVRGGGDKSLEASLRVSLAEEILEIERNDSATISMDDMSDAIDQLIRAAKIYDDCDRPLDGWRQRVRVLSVLREFGRDDLRYRFVDRIDELKAAMGQFGNEIPTYTSSISGAPRYLANQREVFNTNEELGVNDRGDNIIGHDSARIGV